jgi:hypothetical protein
MHGLEQAFVVLDSSLHRNRPDPAVFRKQRRTPESEPLAVPRASFQVYAGTLTDQTKVFTPAASKHA